MQQNTFWLTATDGVQLFTRTWMPEETPPKGAIQIAHGMCEHSGRYESLATALVNAGYAVYAGDRRGHGRTAQKPEDFGHLAPQGGWNLVLSDLLSLTKQMQRLHQHVPCFLIGHSMGSFLAQHYLIRYANTLNGAIFSGTNGKIGSLLWLGNCVSRFETWRQGSRGKSAFLEFLSFGTYNNVFKPNRTRFDWLTRDSAEVDRYLQDPLCGFRCTNQFWNDFTFGLGEIEKPENIAQVPKEFPILILAGSDDPVGNKTKGVKKLVHTYKNAGLKNVTCRFYEGGRHEIFNEVNREEVYKDVIQWLEKQLRVQSVLT